jgi:F-type H+-transporting ATPase subunit delta
LIRDIIAKRYARAYFSLVREQGRMAEAESELKGFVSFFEGSQELSRVLCNPVFEVAERQAVLSSVVEKLELSRELKSLLAILLDKNKIAYLGLVYQNFAALVDDAEGRAEVEVRTAAKLDKAALTALRKEFSRLTGKKVQLKVKVDKSLIGGVVARYGGMVYDGSVRTQLNLLGEALKA